jgi:hypothetical protein
MLVGPVFREVFQRQWYLQAVPISSNLGNDGAIDVSSILLDAVPARYESETPATTRAAGCI